MGIRGARSLLDGDPSRYCETFRVNWDEQKKKTILLIDAMALLYHCAMKVDGCAHASPATVRESVSTYVYKLLNVAKSTEGAVHIFLDALPPREKTPTQIERSKVQAIDGDALARGDPSSRSAKVMHLLAEWSFVEAVESLMSHPELGSQLFLYRARRGEAEPYINYWLEQNSSLLLQSDVQVGILSDDTDFLVYPSCPGFIPLASIQFAQHLGRPCMQGRHYLRSKFIKSFLPSGTSDSTTIMTTISALAGCDYVLGVNAERSIQKFRQFIISSDISGLRQKVRNSPSAAASLTAVLRFVAHHLELAASRGQEWMLSMLSDQPQERRRTLLSAFTSIHHIYTHTLQISTQPELELSPGSVDVWRLLEYGIMYCPPLIETWTMKQSSERDNSRKASKKRSLQDNNDASVDYIDLVDAGAYAIITSPPFTRQIATWMDSNTVWLMPHYRQIRARLYSVIRKKRLSEKLRSKPGDYDPVWTSDTPFIKEFVRYGTGRSIDIQTLNVRIPDHEHVSTGVKSREILKQDMLTIDRVLLFCVLGNPRQAASAEKQASRRNGTLFLASLTLPYNLACLLILMGTAPALDGFNLHPPASIDACNEVNEALPLLSVACFHALLLVNTVTTVFGRNNDDLSIEEWEEEPLTLASKVFVVSDTIRHDNALLIWQCLRLVAENLEESCLDEGGSANIIHIERYLESAFDELLRLQTENEAWRAKLKTWKKLATPLWVTWWSTFNLDLSEKASPLQ